MIKERLSPEVKKAKYFSVLPDEAADVSNVEQMPLVIRYVNSDSEICEAFTGFIACDEGVSGEAISEKVLQGVEDLSLNMIFCRGQGYDGAGNMAGKCSGAARRIADKYPKVPYVHFGSHALNLSVASACNIQVVRNMMVRVKAVFFNVSPKRFSLLTKKIQEFNPNARHNHLIDVCRTRWVARIDGLDVFAEVLEPVVNSLETIKDNVGGKWNSDSVMQVDSSTRLFLSIYILSSCCLSLSRSYAASHQATSVYDVRCSCSKRESHTPLCDFEADEIGNI